MSKLTDAGFVNNHRGITRVTWLHLSIPQIIKLGNSIIRGYDNYYSFAFNRVYMSQYIFYIIRDVIARTLAHKMALKSRAKVFKKYGPLLTIYDLEKRDANNCPTMVAQLFKPSTKMNVWDFKIKHVKQDVMALYINSVSLARLENLSCSVCSSTFKVEMHHIRMLKNLKPVKGSLDYLMAHANRKQIPLCRLCHNKYHAGTLSIK